jgi:two-component system chemotaxis response regulator CheB
MAKKILIVDDSALIRKQLGDILDKAGFDIGFAKNGLEAVEFVEEVDFDAITMDINMPVMDGLSAVKEIMKRKPTPIIMVSSLTQDDADVTFESLEFGAVDYVPKPGTISLNIEETKQEIIEKVKMASKLPKNRLFIRKMAVHKKVSLKSNPKTEKKEISNIPSRIVLIGASTGGPGLIEEIVTSLPEDYPYPVCIVQHMPESFTAKFAQRLDKNSNVEVVEAKAREILKGGKVIIGKGGWHFHISKKGSGIFSAKLVPNTMKRFFMPSVDELFFSVSKIFDCKRVMAVLLTGIGDDGADGMVELRKKGAYTIAESEETAVVYGMPKEAYERGGAVKKLPFSEIVKEILNYPNLKI